MKSVIFFTLRWISYGWMVAAILVALILLFGENFTNRTLVTDNLLQASTLLFIGYGFCGLGLGLALKMIKFSMKMIKDNI